jgi:hypothetical protein
MNWDELSAISTFVTMIVIAASAIAAVFQLRHMRAGNAINAFLGLMDKWASPQAREISNYVFSGAVQQKLQDPDYRREVFSSPIVNRLVHPEFQYLDFWESIGMFVKLGYFAEDAVMESGGPTAIKAWQVLMPVVAIVRAARGPTIFDNFEYLVSRAMLWESKHPEGLFPHKTPHLPVVGPFSNEGGRNDA